MRTFLTFVASLIALSILAAVGLGIYNAGVAQGIIEAGRIPAGAAVPIGYGYGYGFGGYHPFGFLGLLFPILFIFLIFGVIRAASGRGRRWGGGWGGRWGGPEGYRGFPPGSPEDRQHWVAEMHRRLHDTEGWTGSGSGTAGGSDRPSAGPGEARGSRPS